MENKIIAIIMAAGDGTRMNSFLPKVMHKICGYPIIEYVVSSATGVSNCEPVVILGNGAEEVEEYLGPDMKYAYQHERLGTGHAVMMAKNYLENRTGYALVLAGDIPLIKSETLQGLVDYCQKGDYDAVALSAIFENADGYGRIVRNTSGDFERIVEHRDATDEERLIKEINASIYCFSIPSLLKGLSKLDNNNAQGEYYLTDVLGILKRQKKRIGVYSLYDSSQIMGINTRVQLAQVQKIMNRRINHGHLENGVTIIDPDNTYIGPYVKIERDVVIYPGNVLEGRTSIGEGSILYPNSRILDSNIGAKTQIQNSVILESQIGDQTTVGPFAYIRPGSVIGNKVRIGDFVEVKNAQIGEGSKVSHLTYVGNGEVGKNVNIGCGVVFVNYDGKKKHRTIVEDNAFIGCNTNLISPVTIKSNSYIAAGSTITDDVPNNALGIARARQINKENWVKKHEKEMEEN